MTNEELAAGIKAGETSLIPELWESVKGYLFKICLTAYRKSLYRCSATGTTLEDMKQLAYIAFRQAIKVYDPEKGALFLGYAKMCLRNEINAALGLYKKDDLLNMSVSLDTPIDGEEGATIGEMVIDQSAEQELTDAETALFFTELHGDLERCLETLPESDSAAIRAKYYSGKTIERAAETRALRQLRKPNNRYRLSGYAAELFEGMCYLRTGEKSFIEDQASSPERMTEALERWKRNAKLGEM